MKQVSKTQKVEYENANKYRIYERKLKDIPLSIETKIRNKKIDY